MKRFNGTEMAALALAAVLFVGGASMLIWPQAEVIPHPTVHRGGSTPWEDIVSESGAQKRGVISMVFGAGLAVFTVYRKQPKKIKLYGSRRLRPR